MKYPCGRFSTGILFCNYHQLTGGEAFDAHEVSRGRVLAVGTAERGDVPM
ncbi:MAG TPA: hypothetical protein PKH47_07025 [Anaerolineales bacterium]|nr:hypothetical protein [Anaerolineales bacterium]